MKIRLIRGDSKILGFPLNDKKGNPLELKENDEIYFTVKKDENTEEFEFQKTLGNGIEYDSTRKLYIININPSDTEEMEYGTYGWDIEVDLAKEEGEPYVNTPYEGTLKITKEYTHKNNKSGGAA